MKFFGKQYNTTFSLLCPQEGSERISKRSPIFDLTLCSQLKYIRRFKETCYLYLKGRRISQARNQKAIARVALLAICFMLVSCMVYTLSGSVCYQLHAVDSCLAYTLIPNIDVT
jgi:hypothetical protein